MFRAIFRRFISKKQALIRSYAAASDGGLTESHQLKNEKKNDKYIKKTGSFVMSVFKGHVKTEQLFPYPDVLSAEEKSTLDLLLGPTKKFYEEVNNADHNDEIGEIEPHLIKQLGELGVFGLQTPEEYGGLGLNNTQFARMVEMIASYDLAVAISVLAHQSIGYKGILLFGDKLQKQKYLPDLARGKTIAAYCLTEPGSGSDARSIKARAVKSVDGRYFTLNGTKLWISNGGIADIFTVFAKVPVETENGTVEKMSAFIVERKFGGVSSGPPEKKMGLKASNTAGIFFDDVKIPTENLIGEVGDGFKVAMNILNSGRFALVAGLSGTMRAVIEKAVNHAYNRSQFGNKILSYGTIQEKIFRMCMLQYVTESMAYMVSGIMDRGFVDFQLEAAISKVYATEAAWVVVDDAIQILGGMGYMRSAGLERVMRDLRVFRIFEGANDILRLFVASKGIQHAGNHQELQKASLSDHIHPKVNDSGQLLSKCIEGFGASVEEVLIKHGKNILSDQFLLNRLANAVIDIFAMASILSRVTFSLNKNASSVDYEEKIVNVYCFEAYERIFHNLAVLKSGDKMKNFEFMKAVALDVGHTGGQLQIHPLSV